MIDVFSQIRERYLDGRITLFSPPMERKTKKSEKLGEIALKVEHEHRNTNHLPVTPRMVRKVIEINVY